MSGPNSKHWFFTRLDAASLDDDAPVSTYRAFELQQNLQHLIDMYAQHRINWSSTGNDDAHLFVANDGVTHYWSKPFLHTWLTPTWPCGLDIHIHGSISDSGSTGDMLVEARIVPVTVGLREEIQDPYWEATGHVTAGDTLAINAIFYPGTTVQTRGGWRRFNIHDAAGNSHGVTVCLSRLDVTMSATGSGSSVSTHGLTHVLVREFC